MIASGKSNPSINSRKIGNFALQIVAFLIVPTYFTWGIITFSLLWYKYAWLPYGGRSTFPVEVVTCILVTALSIPMGALIRRGNVLEQYIPLVVGTCVLLIASGGVLYFMLYQTYVLFLDFIVSLCVLVCMAVLLSCILVTFIQITIHIRRKRKDRLRQHAASVSNITRTKRMGVDFENVDTSQLECQRLTEQVAVRPDTH